MLGIADFTFRSRDWLANSFIESLTIFLVGLWMWGGLAHDTATAQTSSYTKQEEAHPSQSSQVGSLPDWAQPKASSSSQGESLGSQRETTSGGKFRTQNHNDRHPVPVDGGLIWLFVAGAGYGAYRLRGGED